jgi:osmotically-inducible protein OsmY
MPNNEIKVEDLVSAALLTNDRLGRAVIEVKGVNGVITLRGTIESEQHRSAAEVLVREQEGVVQVINKLRVPVF